MLVKTHRVTIGVVLLHRDRPPVVRGACARLLAVVADAPSPMADCMHCITLYRIARGTGC